MSLIKVPTWFELFKQKQDRSSASYWKEQAERFGFDTRKSDTEKITPVSELTDPWKSFFYEKALEYTLKKVAWNVQELSFWERFYWKRYSLHIEAFTISSSTLQGKDCELLLSWLTALQSLTFHQTNRLLQIPSKTALETLKTITFSNLHLLSKEALSFIPKTIEHIIIRSCRKIDPAFLEALHDFHKLATLVITHSGGIEPHFLNRLPKSLQSLDLSYSGKGVDSAFLELVPQSVRELKLNGWQHCGDNELTKLPCHLVSLEIDEWNITAKGLQTIGAFPLQRCSLQKCASGDFAEALSALPQSLCELDISDNNLKAKELHPITALSHLVKLACKGLRSASETAIQFPLQLQELDISHSGSFDKQTIQGLKSLRMLQTLKASSCAFENEDIEFLPEYVEHLDLSHCALITDTGISFLSQHACLKSVSFDGCEQIRGFGLSALSQDVKRVSLKGCHRLSGKSLPVLPPAIEELYLASCELIASIDTQYLPNTLRVVDLSFCPQICNNAIDFLGTLPLLHTIHFTGCTKISADAILALIRRKFEGTIMIECDLDLTNKVHGIKNHEHDIELHPPISTLKKISNFKAKLINRLGRLL